MDYCYLYEHAGWSGHYIHTWDGTSTLVGEWNASSTIAGTTSFGTAIPNKVQIGSDWYYYFSPGNYDHLLLSQGDDGNKTSDLTPSYGKYQKNISSSWGWRTFGGFTVTLNHDGAESYPLDPTVEFNGTAPSSITPPTKTGYVFGGYWSNSTCDELMIIDPSGAWLANKEGYTDGSKHWIHEGGSATLYAKWYTDPRVWCDPNVTVTGDVHLTSTKDVFVQSTTAASNLLNITSADWGSATSMEIAYLNADAADAKVAKASSVFRIYAADVTGNPLDHTSSTVDISASRTFNTDYSIRYTPSDYAQLHNYKLQLTFKKGDQTLKTVTHNLYGRSLPEEFVIAVKKGDIWVALPSNLASTSAQPSIVPQPITVDNTTTPTTAVYASTNTVYKATDKGNDSHLSTLRFTTTGSNYLQVSGSDYYNMWLSTTNSPTVQDWQLKSTDFNAYELTIPSNGENAAKKMGIYNSTYMGYHGSPNNANIYFLPITNKYTDVPATVQEWGEHGVIIAADMTNVASATMHIDDASAVAADLTAVNAASLTAGKYVRVYNEAVTVGAVANENKLLYIHWKNEGETEIGVSQVTIPCVVASDATMSSIAGTKAAWSAKSEVHILPGVTLDANASSFGGAGALSVSNMFVYPGATLKVSTGTFNATTLRLRNGWTHAGEKKYDVARVYIADDAALSKTTASMDYDIYEASDGKHYYPLAVPFETAVSGIDYIDETLAGASTYGTHYVIKEYDGANRAENGAVDANWKVVGSDKTLKPGVGYIMTGVGIPAYGGCVIRIPLTFDNAWTSDGEKGTANYDDADHTKNQVTVTHHTGTAATANKCHEGWNMLGVPYMSCFASKSNATHEKLEAFITGKMTLTGDPADPYGWDEDGVVYVTVPTHDFSEYLQYNIDDEDTKLLPGWSFFVQFAKSGTLTFATAGQATSGLPIYAPKREESPVVKTGIVLSDGTKSDKTTFLISDKYNSEYEIGADLEKMFGNAFTLSTYSITNGTKLAFNALSTYEAQQAIPVGVRIPADGEYTFSLNSRYADANIERLDLIDYEAGEVTNLLQADYTFTATSGQNDSRFALNIKKAPAVVTDIENTEYSEQNTDIRKVIIDDKMFIIRDGLMYDATGKKVKGNR